MLTVAGGEVFKNADSCWGGGGCLKMLTVAGGGGV